MKVTYTLPGMLPEASRVPAADAGEMAPESFGAQLQRLRVPEFTDWRSLLRLDVPPAGLAGFGPPLPPRGIAWRDGASERKWWRGMLQKHAAVLDDPDGGDANAPAVQCMLAYLQESQRAEDEIFARQVAEDRN